MRALGLARAGCAAVLVVCSPHGTWAQDRQPPPMGLLQQSFPDPFSRRTAMPFEVLPTACPEGRDAMVRIEILNVLVQVVAFPTLWDSAGAQQILDIPLPCGRYLAFWDRTLMDGERKARPGSYFYRLYVNGESQAVRLVQVREQVARPSEAVP